MLSSSLSALFADAMPYYGHLAHYVPNEPLAIASRVALVIGAILILLSLASLVYGPPKPKSDKTSEETSEEAKESAIKAEAIASYRAEIATRARRLFLCGILAMVVAFVAHVLSHFFSSVHTFHGKYGNRQDEW